MVVAEGLDHLQCLLPESLEEGPVIRGVMDLSGCHVSSSFIYERRGLI